MRYAFDSDICIYLMNDRYPALNERVAALEDRPVVSSVALAELCFGAEKSRKQAHNRRELEFFLAQVDVLPFDAAAARHYGQIRAELEAKGTPCGGNDMLIGAHARSLGLILVTNNIREFQRMPGLEVENWAS